MYLYAPLAHRLGLYAIKSELEDLFLKYTDTEAYQDIVHKINESKSYRNKFIKSFIQPVEDELIRQGFRFTIKGRPKSVYSIFNKMKTQAIPFEEVFDLFAVRIILDSELENEKADCWQAYSIVTDFYRPNPNRLRDWISTPRSNGYESLHTTVMSTTGQWVEVQIRTGRMNDIAERGYAAHWKYKEKDASGKSGPGLDEWINQVRSMLESNDGSAIEFMDDFRGNLFNDEVFVFTPKGDLKVLPTGASALDFAFEIHTMVGAKCIGAKVNQRLVPISYKLKNGDQVEILTSSKQKPTEDWLHQVVTSRAKAKIKDALREEKKSAILDGREIVQRKLKSMKLDFTSEVIEQLRAFFDLKTANEFYYRVGRGIIDPTSIKSFKEFKEQQKQKSKTTEKVKDESSFTKEIKNLKGPEHDQLLWLSPKQTAHPLASRLKLKDYLTAYGASQVDIPPAMGVKPEIRSLTQHLITTIDRYADELSTLNYLAYQADNAKLSIEIPHGPLARPILWELLEQFEHAGLCRINGHQLQFTSAEARFISNGGWLELHTYGIGLNIKKDQAIPSIHSSVKK
jgi:GTP pyrophosphokinase